MHEQFCNHQELVELKDSKKAVKVYTTRAGAPSTVVDSLRRSAWERWERRPRANCSRRYSRATRQQSSCTSTSTTRSLKEGGCLRRLGHE